jgi:hypothetical protein
VRLSGACGCAALTKDVRPTAQLAHNVVACSARGGGENDVGDGQLGLVKHVPVINSLRTKAAVAARWT